MPTVLKTESKKKVKVLKGLSSKQIHRLSELAEQVRNLHDATEKLTKTAAQKSEEALAEALLCGKALLEAKEICGHGKFMTWLAERCKGVSQESANRYMRLSKSSPVTNLDNIGGLTEAYKALGIIRVVEPKEKAKQEEETPAADCALKVPQAETIPLPITGAASIAVATSTAQAMPSNEDMVAERKKWILHYCEEFLAKQPECRTLLGHGLIETGTTILEKREAA